MRHGLIGLAFSIAVSACGEDPPPPVQQQQKAPETPVHLLDELQFVETIRKHDPSATTVAEVSVSHEGRMKAVIVTSRDDAWPQVELWTFAQRDDEEIKPLGDPKPMMQVDARARDTPELEALRREMAAPATVLARPQGLPLQTATEALDRMQVLAKNVRAAEAHPDVRKSSLAEFLRGLDDDIWLSQQRVPWMLELLAEGPWIVIGQPDGSAHRTRMRAKPGQGKPEYSLAFLLKTGGWVLQEFEQRR